MTDGPHFSLGLFSALMPMMTRMRGARHQLEMRGVHARSIAASVVKNRPERDRSSMLFVDRAMRFSHSAVSTDTSVSLGRKTSLPDPAPFGRNSPERPDVVRLPRLSFSGAFV
jgi:hypothetical protein